MSSDLLAAFDRALAATGQVISGIRADQWHDVTPCPGLDVRDLVAHLVSGHLTFAALVRGEPRPELASDPLGDDPLATFRRTGQDLRHAFGAPGALESSYQAPFGTAPGPALVHVRILELLGHGWDLARATGQPADFPPDVAERTLAKARRQLAGHPARPGAPFAPERPVASDAAAIDRLAGFLGRDV